jgi:hypothetical protein
VIPGFRKSSLTSNLFGADSPAPSPLEEFGYGDITLLSVPHEQQLQQTHALLMELSEDSLLKPFRNMVGQAAPGEDLGGWYQYDANNRDHLFEIGFDARLASGFRRWRGPMPSTGQRRRGRRCYG